MLSDQAEEPPELKVEVQYIIACKIRLRLLRAQIKYILSQHMTSMTCVTFPYATLGMGLIIVSEPGNATLEFLKPRSEVS
jgi:hypothetical protein